jgi:hypothetical protein
VATQDINVKSQDACICIPYMYIYMCGLLFFFFGGTGGRIQGRQAFCHLSHSANSSLS